MSSLYVSCRDLGYGCWLIATEAGWALQVSRAGVLARRLQEPPRLVALKRKSLSDYGDAYCGGEIEASLCKVAS